MPDVKALRDAFVDELRDTYDAEKQLIKALPKLAKAAAHPKLREAFTDHLRETEGQTKRLEKVFRLMDLPARGKHCEGMAGIIEEGKSLMAEDFDPATMDAVLIASGQRAEHYEMAAYRALVAWASVLGLDDARDLLQENMDEEGAADKALSALAEGGINQAAGNGRQDSASDSDSAAGGMFGRLLGGATENPPKTQARRGAKNRASDRRVAKRASKRAKTSRRRRTAARR